MNDISPTELLNLEKEALTIREHIVKMTTIPQSGHPGSSLSSVEILVALYFAVMKHDPKNPAWEDRDRFVISKGHGVPVVYAALAETGYFPVDWLWTLRQINSRLQGHPSRLHTPGIEASTGSLGQGISIGIGMALAGKMDKKDYYTYVLLGDGELDEGQVWEAAAAAWHMQLDHLTVILDSNRFQLSGSVDEIMPKGPIAERWKAFGWNVVEIDGHNLGEIIQCLQGLRQHPTGKPNFVIAHTVKGKGVSFMENNNHFHGVAATKEEEERALKELEAAREQLLSNVYVD